MAEKKKIVAICGSTRKGSTNHHLIEAIAALTKEKFTITIFDSLADLPHFNPDNGIENISRKVAHFKQLLSQADGVIICTPEYAHGVPGTLKNAIDWTVATSEFSQKPTMLITASTDGQYAHRHLLETLQVIEAKHIEELQLVIPFAKTKISSEGVITDNHTLKEIKQLIEKLGKKLNND